MPNIEALITELRTIATAQQGLGTFIYADPQDINNHRDKSYPLALADRNISIDQLGLKSRQHVYTFKLYFYDLYSRTEMATKATEHKQKGLELIGEEFLQEFRQRYKANDFPWRLENEDQLTGQWGFYKQNDRLVQLVYQLKIRSQGACLAGTFVY